MRAARLHAEMSGLRLEEMPKPVPGPGEVLIAIAAAGLCGTDLHIAWERSLPVPVTPITLGHEGAGIVAALGPEVSGWSQGDRVTLHPSIPCGTCRSCRAGRLSLCPKARILGLHTDGTFAEYVAVPAGTLRRLPQGVDFETGAILGDAVATAYHAVMRRGSVRKGETVAVIGCGGVGYHGVLFAKHAGASRIIAVDQAQGALARAQAVGATDLVVARDGEVSTAIRSLTAGEGVDVAFEFVGKARTVEEAVRSVGRPGRVVVVGVGAEQVRLPPLAAFVGRELSVIGSMGSYREDLEEVLALLEAGAVDLGGSVTHRFSLDEIGRAFETLATKEGHPVRIVVIP